MNLWPGRPLAPASLCPPRVRHASHGSVSPPRRRARRHHDPPPARRRCPRLADRPRAVPAQARQAGHAHQLGPGPAQPRVDDGPREGHDVHGRTEATQADRRGRRARRGRYRRRGADRQDRDELARRAGREAAHRPPPRTRELVRPPAPPHRRCRDGRTDLRPHRRSTTPPSSTPRSPRRSTPRS